jgi:hypothetical protein
MHILITTQALVSKDFGWATIEKKIIVIKRPKERLESMIAKLNLSRNHATDARSDTNPYKETLNPAQQLDLLLNGPAESTTDAPGDELIPDHWEAEGDPMKEAEEVRRILLQAARSMPGSKSPS